MRDASLIGGPNPARNLNGILDSLANRERSGIQALAQGLTRQRAYRGVSLGTGIEGVAVQGVHPEKRHQAAGINGKRR